MAKTYWRKPHLLRRPPPKQGEPTHNEAQGNELQLKAQTKFRQRTVKRVRAIANERKKER